MTLTPGTVMTWNDMIQTIPGCTVSRELRPIRDGGAILFALAEDTDISPETWSSSRLIWNLQGHVDVYTSNKDGVTLDPGEAVWTLPDRPNGFRTKTDTLYLELAADNNQSSMRNPKPGEVFTLADLVPVQKGTIVNRDLFQSNGMKFVVMAFDEGTGLSEHTAPGQALVTVLEGDAVVTYEGVDHTLHAGESIAFAPQGRHAIKALTPFKMSLLIALA